MRSRWFVAVSLLLPLLALVPDLSADALATVTPHTLVKGVALLDWGHKEDLVSLGAAQYYGWGEFCGALPNCTNMVRNWTLPAACYPSLLVGNEPLNPEPAGHPISTHDAVTSTLAIAALCPNTQLIVANIFLDNGWLAAYLAEYKQLTGQEYGTIAHVGGLFDLIGFHIYSNTADDAIDRALDVTTLPGYHGHFWITEFHVTWKYQYPASDEFRQFLRWVGLQPRIDRVYVWTNRLGEDYFNLVNGDGTLTVEGQQYRDWVTTSTVWSLNVPFVKGASQGYP